MTKSLPLPPRYFQCPALSAREEQYLVAKARESTRALVDATRNNDGPVRWAEMGMHRGVQMYKGEARHPETVVGDPITYGCGATTLQASLDEVAGFFDLATHAKVRDFVAFNGDMMDAQLLYALKDPELADKDPLHQITVRWFVIEMPSKLIKNRDFLTIECQNTFVDVSGRRGWVRSYHSIKLPSCPDLQHEYGLVRGSFYHTGHVFIESERPGYLDVIFSAQINLKGNLRLPSALFFVAAKKRLSSVAELQKQLQKRRLGAQRFLGDLELVPKSQRTRCAICSVKFGLLTRKARCRKCGEVVCTSCSDVWEISVPKVGTKKVRVCAKCAKSSDKQAALHPDALLSQSQSEVDDDALSSVRSGTPSTATGGYAYGQYEKEVPMSPSAASSATTATANGRRAVSAYQHQQSSSIGREPTSRSVNHEYYGRNNPRRGPTPTGTSFLSAGNGDDYLQSEGSDYGEEFEYGHHPHNPPPNRAPQHPQQQQTYGSVSSSNGRGGNGLYRQDSGGYDDPYARRQQPPTPVRYNRSAGNGSDPAARRGMPANDPFEEQQARALEMNNQAQLLRQHYQEQQRAMHGYSAPKADVVSALPPPHHAHHPSRETQMSDDTVSSASDFDDVSGGAGVTLTPQMLAMHTRQMGKPGPVTRNPAQYTPQGIASRQQPLQRPPPQQAVYHNNGYGGAAPPYPTKSVSSSYNEPPPRAYSNQRMGYDEFEQPPAYDQLYGGAPAAPTSAANGSERYGRTKSHRSQLSSVESGAADDYEVRSYRSGRSNSQHQQYAPAVPVNDSDARSERSQPRFRQVGSSGGGSNSSGSGGHTTNNNNRPPVYAPPPPQHAPSTQSDLDDEGADQFDDDDVGSPVTNALADNFSNLLRPEDLRSTVESFRFSVGSSTMDPTMSFCESLNDYDENPMPYGSSSSHNTTSGAAAAATTAPSSASAAAKPQPVTKTMIVLVYQQVLELTKRQHELDASPAADPSEKSEVARELQVLYQKLNQITQDPEVEL